MSKFMFLHKNSEPSELKTLDVLGSVLLFRDGFLTQTYAEVFAKYDVVVLDIDNKNYKQWYASYKAAISADVNIKVVFLHPAHVHIDKEISNLLRTEWKVDSIMKELPVFKDKADLIAKLINNIHLASLDLPEAESCFKSALYAIAEKMGCGSK